MAPDIVPVMGPGAVPREGGVLVAQRDRQGPQHGSQMLGCLGCALRGEAVVKVLGGQRRRVERVVGLALYRGAKLTLTTAGSAEDPGQGHQGDRGDDHDDQRGQVDGMGHVANSRLPGVSTIADSLVSLSALPGVAEATAAARRACTQLRWHEALRRRIPAAAAESRVRGARASAALDGAEMDLDLVRDLMRGATPWPQSPGPLEATLQAAVQATAESEHIRALVVTAPSQALARVHAAAAGHLLPQSQVGRPRQGAEMSLEFSDLGPSPDEAVVRERLSGIVELLLCARDGSAVVVAALVHAEIATVRPFVRGNGLVARAMERAVIQASGMDPTGVAVVELATWQLVRPIWGRWRPTVQAHRRVSGCGSHTVPV